MVDLKAVEEKMAKGEALSQEELKEVMSLPPDGESNQLAPEDDIPPEEYHEEKPAKPAAEAKKAPEDKKTAKTSPDGKQGQEEPAKGLKKASEGTATEAEDKDPLPRINQELAKPDGQEDLSDLTPRSKALFWELKRERKIRQDAEAERDILKREKATRERDDKQKALKDKKDAVLKGKSPDDPVTVKDLQAIEEAGAPDPLDTDSTKQKVLFDPNSPLVAKNLKRDDIEARAELGADYDETVECTAEIISNNPAYLQKLSQALLKGENVAKLAYSLIKGDPEYPAAVVAARARLKAAGKKTSEDTEGQEEQAPAKKKPEDEATKAALDKQKQLEDNTKKPKTSAHVDGTEQGAAKIGEYTVEQLVNMSDAQFAKVDKKTREKFLKQIG